MHLVVILGERLSLMCVRMGIIAIVTLSYGELLVIHLCVGLMSMSIFSSIRTIIIKLLIPQIIPRVLM